MNKLLLIAMACIPSDPQYLTDDCKITRQNDIMGYIERQNTPASKGDIDAINRRLDQLIGQSRGMMPPPPNDGRNYYPCGLTTPPQWCTRDP